MSKQQQNLSRESINREDILGGTALYYAVKGNQVKEASVLIEIGPDFTKSGNRCALDLPMFPAMSGLLVEKRLIFPREKVRAALINQAKIPEHAWFKKDVDDYLGEDEFFSRAAIEKILGKASKLASSDEVMHALLPVQAAVFPISEQRLPRAPLPTIAESPRSAVERLQSRSSAPVQRG